MTELTHLDEHGSARMVDITDKAVSHREATAEAEVAMQPETLQRLLAGNLPKGDVFATARLAGIQAAKKTADLIPLCHPLALSAIDISFEPDVEHSSLWIRARCKLDGKTGVEMEAMTAASVAALTVYDMCKAVEKGVEIRCIRLIAKSGGKSGDYNLNKSL